MHIGLRNHHQKHQAERIHQQMVLERLFADWERRWCECRECLPEVIPAVQHLREKRENSRAATLNYWGFSTGWRIGELEIALGIVQQEEALCLELGDKDSLQRSYGGQASILRRWGQLEEAFELLKKEEAPLPGAGQQGRFAGELRRPGRDPN